MNQRKSLKELNLLDKFLFDEAMDDPENVKTMLAKKYSAEQISAMLEVDVSEVENIMKEIQNEKNP